MYWGWENVLPVSVTPSQQSRGNCYSPPLANVTPVHEKHVLLLHCYMHGNTNVTCRFPVGQERYYSKGLRVSQPKAYLFWNLSFYLTSDVKKDFTPCISDPRSMYLFIFFIREMGKRKGGGLAGSIYLGFSLCVREREAAMQKHPRNLFLLPILFFCAIFMQELGKEKEEEEDGGEIFWRHCPGLSKVHHARHRRKEVT